MMAMSEDKHPESKSRSPSISQIAKSIIFFKLKLDHYAFFLLVILILRFLPWRPTIVEIISNFLHLLLLPAIPILIFLLIKKQWKRVALWVLPTIAFIMLFGNLFFPNFEASRYCAWKSSACRHIKVMTFNAFGYRAQNRETQIEMIRDSGADIIALQEVDHDLSKTIEIALDDLYPHRILYPDGTAGTGILSKYPILDYEILKLSNHGMYHTRATIEMYGAEITVLSAHPPPPVTLSQPLYTVRGSSEITELLKQIPQDGPAILMGDFNITDQSADYTELSGSRLKDAFREVGWGFGPTWPNRIQYIGNFIPLLRIDYVWHSDDFQAISAHTGPWAKSDHLPLIVELEYKM